MKTSRQDGILVLKTNKPYKMAIAGDPNAERYLIVCKDIDYNTEKIAYDLEQSLTTAILSASAMSEKIKKIFGNKSPKDEKESNEFYEKESPSEEEIEEAANAILALFRMNTEIKLSNIMELFEEIVFAGLVCCENNVRMTKHIWNSIHRKDKQRIAFSYISFFVNPLQQLSNTFASMEKKESGKVIKESGKP